MNVEAFATDLRSRLVTAAGSGGPEIREAAERLAEALDPAIQLGLLGALSDAAAEINAELRDGSVVELRLSGRAPNFVVIPPPEVAEPPAPAEDPGEDSTLARISLRLPDALKARAEDRANRAGQSLNSWLVAAVRAAVDGPAIGRTGKRIQGWVR